MTVLTADKRTEARVKAECAAEMLQRGLARPERFTEYLRAAAALIAAAQAALAVELDQCSPPITPLSGHERGG